VFKARVIYSYNKQTLDLSVIIFLLLVFVIEVGASSTYRGPKVTLPTDSRPTYGNPRVTPIEVLAAKSPKIIENHLPKHQW